MFHRGLFDTPVLSICSSLKYHCRESFYSKEMEGVLMLSGRYEINLIAGDFLLPGSGIVRMVMCFY